MALPASTSLQPGLRPKSAGALVPSQGKGQQWEIQAQTLTLIGGSEESYPLQKKRHSLEYLREIAHLRPARQSLRGGLSGPEPALLRGP
jgi:aspartyl/asparaginyl-tRNA synthetase